jgi:hypothetical protein
MFIKLYFNNDGRHKTIEIGVTYRLKCLSNYISTMTMQQDDWALLEEDQIHPTPQASNILEPQ